MSKILVCQHVPYEILGTLDPLLRKKGFRIKFVNFGRFPDAEPGIKGYEGLIVLGGPMNVGQAKDYPHLKYEKKLILDAIKADIPVLGICLGAQLIASALGAKIKKSPEKEIGWYNVVLTKEGHRDPLFKHFKLKEKIFQMHGDMFDVPKDAVLLASAPGCPHQAFRYGNKVYGFQFHLEVDEPLVERWLRVLEHREELKELRKLIEPDEIRVETHKRISHLKKLSNRTFAEFIKLFGHKKSVRRLSTR